MTTCKPRKSLPLSVGAPTWAPAVEQRGEGLFLQIQEQKVAEWEKLADNNVRVDALRNAYNRWHASRQLPLRSKLPIPGTFCCTR